MIATRHFNHWGYALAFVALTFGFELLGRWYWREAQQLRRRLRRAKRIRAWRERMTAMAARPFHMRMLTAGERSRLINASGQTSDEWFHAIAGDYVAGRREHMPTCGDYLAEFGRRPKVRSAMAAKQ